MGPAAVDSAAFTGRDSRASDLASPDNHFNQHEHNEKHNTHPFHHPSIIVCACFCSDSVPHALFCVRFEILSVFHPWKGSRPEKCGRRSTSGG